MLFTREHCRYFLKNSVLRTIDAGGTDQNDSIEAPPIEKPAPADGTCIDPGTAGELERYRLYRPGRGYCRTQEPPSLSAGTSFLDERSLLLWAAQGIRAQRGGTTAFRTVPSAGCRNIF